MDQRNHVKLAGSDIELGDSFSVPGGADNGVAAGTTTELLEKQEMTVTLVSGERRNTGVTKSDISDSPDGYITQVCRWGYLSCFGGLPIIPILQVIPYFLTFKNF